MKPVRPPAGARFARFARLAGSTPLLRRVRRSFDPAAFARWSLFAALLLAFILVPFWLLEEGMQAWTQRTLLSGGSLAWVTLAVVGLLLADIALPIPSSFVLASTGVLLGVGVGTLVGFIGLTAAALAGYALGRLAGQPLAERVVGREQLERFAALTTRHGEWLLVATRAMPVAAEAATLLAGTARMPLARFVLVTSIGNAIVALAYAWIGARAADERSFVFAFVACMLVPALVMLVVQRALSTPAPR